MQKRRKKRKEQIVTANKMQKNNKGITLVALVVTIVILIILATISVSALFGENGLIKKAQETREHQSNAIAMEEEKMNELLAEYANAMSEEETIAPPVEEELPEITPITPVGTKVKSPTTWTSNKVIAISDGSGNAIPLPDGFYYIGGDRSSGLVISDMEGDTLTSSYPNSGNQFIWIPVDNESDFERSNFGNSSVIIAQQQNSSIIKLSNVQAQSLIIQIPTSSSYNISPTAGEIGDGITYSEPYARGYSDGNGTEEAAEFNTMKTQVLKYGGFYIGRYEAGNKTNGTTLRTKVTTDHEVVVQKGVAPYNYIPWGQSMTDIDTAFIPTDNNSDNVTTHGAAYLAKNMYTGKVQANSVTSTLCYGSQWDAMCRYIEEYDRTTPTKSAPELTGSVSTDVLKNIYDLAGNCYEWTFEASNRDHRVFRGGSFYVAAPVSDRYDNGPGSTYNYDRSSFRPSLYVKD